MLVIREVWVNQTGNYICGDSGYYRPFTEDLGRLFRSLQKEYGRCVSPVYRDTPDGTHDKIGWVFEKQAKYEDTGEPYMAETWVSYRYVKEL
jgi:hypothetical protein